MAATPEGTITEGITAAANATEAGNNQITSSRVARQDGTKDPNANSAPNGPNSPTARNWASNESNVPNAPNVQNVQNDAPSRNATGSRSRRGKNVPSHNGKNALNCSATGDPNRSATGNRSVRNAPKKAAPPPK